MMSWNYRILANKVDKLYYITEAYYDDAQVTVRGYVAEGVQPAGETLDELRWCLEEMLEAFNRPILEHTEEDEDGDEAAS